MNKAEYPKTATKLQSLLLNYQSNYNSSGKSQYQGAGNQLMFTQHGKTRDDEGEEKEEKKKPQINLDHITYNDCGGIGKYT